MANRAIKDHIFHENATSIGNGIDYIINGNACLMNLEFVGAESFSARLWVKIVNQNIWRLHPCLQFPELEFINSKDILLTSKDDYYQVSLSAVSALRVELTSLTGTITVCGKAVG